MAAASGRACVRRPAAAGSVVPLLAGLGPSWRCSGYRTRDLRSAWRSSRPSRCGGAAACGAERRRERDHAWPAARGAGSRPWSGDLSSRCRSPSRPGGSDRRRRPAVLRGRVGSGEDVNASRQPAVRLPRYTPQPPGTPATSSTRPLFGCPGSRRHARAVRHPRRATTAPRGAPTTARSPERRTRSSSGSAPRWRRRCPGTPVPSGRGQAGLHRQLAAAGRPADRHHLRLPRRAGAARGRPLQPGDLSGDGGRRPRRRDDYTFTAVLPATMLRRP